MSPLFAQPFAFVGVIHLLPLPGGPSPSLGFEAVRARALADAEALATGGAHAAIIENYGDAPFLSGPVEPHVIAFLAAMAHEIKLRFPELALGINILRNDAFGAMGAAAASGADFIRVNVHTGAMVTDQGLVQGDAGRTLRYRQTLGAQVHIAADVMVKHAVPLGTQDIGAVASDTWKRGRADVLIVTGEATGSPADPARLRAVKAAVPEALVWVGSGVNLRSATSWRALANGAIVGTALHAGGELAAPVDAERVREMASHLGV